jgi:hypothetical protein
MSNYDKDVATLQELQEEANFAAANLAGLREAFAAFPAISPHEANVKILEAFCAPGPVSLSQVSWGLQPGNSNLINELSIRTEEEARLAFAKQIARYSRAEERDFIVKTLLENLKVGRAYEDTVIARTPKLTTNALQSKAAEAKRRAEMRKKSPEELRKIVRTGYQLPAVNLPLLPAEYTRQVLQFKVPSNELKRLIRVHGATAITARLSGRE